MHRFGYSRTNMELGRTTNKTFSLRNVSYEYLAGLIEDNLESLREILKWNLDHNIGLFCVGSGLIPFGSHHMDTLAWPVVFSDNLAGIGQWTEQQQMRLCMHPSRCSHLNSSQSTAVQAAIDDLSYHATMLGSMGLDTSCKIVTCVGGLYQNREESLQRFIQAYSYLPDAVKRRLAIEHDDIFNLREILKIHNATAIPVLFNNLCHEVNNSLSMTAENIREILKTCFKSWESERDGLPIIHYASQDPDGKPGAIARSIDVDSFLQFFNQTEDLDYDIIFESGDKEQSVLRVQQILGKSRFSGSMLIA